MNLKPQADPNAAVRENTVAGAVGAFLFALAGGLLWVLLSRIGVIAGINGVVGVVCAIKGYKVFGKAESKKGVIIAVIMTVIVMILAWYASFAWDCLDAHKQWYQDGEIDYVPTYFECLRFGYIYFEDGELLGTYIKDLVIGLAFCAIGCYGSVRNAFRKVDANKALETERRLENSDFSGGFGTPEQNPEPGTEEEDVSGDETDGSPEENADQSAGDNGEDESSGDNKYFL